MRLLRIANIKSRRLAALRLGDLRLASIGPARLTAGHITRLTITATVAYLVALEIPVGTPRPVLAPLTALLVLQASVFQTLTAGLRKVASVTVGVLIAVAVSAFVPYNWWLLGLLIAVTLIIGRLLRLGDDFLEVPISAMLIFSVSEHGSAATGRIMDTLVGTGIGLLGGLAFGRLRTRPARDAVGELAGRVAAMLGEMADGLRAAPDEDSPDAVQTSQDRARELLEHARDLRGEIERVDDALRDAEDSTRLNPRALRLAPDEVTAHEVALRSGLEALDHSALYLRGLARSIVDSGRDPRDAPTRDPRTRARLADVLSQLSTATRTYGELMRGLPAPGVALEEELAGQLAEAHHKRNELAGVLEPDAGKLAADEAEWPLRGEILSHVDRLRTGLQVDGIPWQRHAGRDDAISHRRPRPRLRPGIARPVTRRSPPAAGRSPAGRG
jgi:fusaric acid resistance family protein